MRLSFLFVYCSFNYSIRLMLKYFVLDAYHISNTSYFMYTQDNIIRRKTCLNNDISMKQNAESMEIFSILPASSNHRLLRSVVDNIICNIQYFLLHFYLPSGFYQFYPKACIVAFHPRQHYFISCNICHIRR